MMTVAMNDHPWLSSLPEGAEFSFYAIFGKKGKEMGSGTGEGRRKGDEGRGRKGREG